MSKNITVIEISIATDLLSIFTESADLQFYLVDELIHYFEAPNRVTKSNDISLVVVLNLII